MTDKLAQKIIYERKLLPSNNIKYITVKKVYHRKILSYVWHSINYAYTDLIYMRNKTAIH